MEAIKCANKKWSAFLPTIFLLRVFLTRIEILIILFVFLGGFELPNIVKVGTSRFAK